MLLTEQEIYGDLLLRKPGADELSSPRKEPDLPIIYSGLNAADTIEGAGNKNHTNGTPLSILIPNLDRHFVHIKQYQDTNRTPRPGHASYASFMKYGPDDDAIGAGIFSGRYTSTIVAAGYVAKKVLKRCGIEVFSYVKELASVRCPDVAHDEALQCTTSYKQMRRDLDPFYQEIYVKGRITMEMRFLEKMRILAEIEQEIDAIRDKAPRMKHDTIQDKYGVHPVLNCPDIEAANAMVDACNKISKTGDSAGGPMQWSMPATRLARRAIQPAGWSKSWLEAFRLVWVSRSSASSTGNLAECLGSERSRAWRWGRDLRSRI
jgi:chorismate synthase